MFWLKNEIIFFNYLLLARALQIMKRLKYQAFS